MTEKKGADRGKELYVGVSGNSGAGRTVDVWGTK